MNVIQLVVQIAMVVILIGIVQSLWRITRTYGGLIGSALNWIGVGIILFSLESLDRVLGLATLSAIDSLVPENSAMVHNIVLVFGLLFSLVGFSKLTKISK